MRFGVPTPAERIRRVVVAVPTSLHPSKDSPRPKPYRITAAAPFLMFAPGSCSTTKWCFAGPIASDVSDTPWRLAEPIPRLTQPSRTDEAPTRIGEPMRAPTSSTVATKAATTGSRQQPRHTRRTRLSRGRPPKWSSDAVPKHRANRANVPSTGSTNQSSALRGHSR
jgi:hypothetical protein